MPVDENVQTHQARAPDMQAKTDYMMENFALAGR